MLETVQAMRDTFAKKRAALSEGINLDDFLTTQDFVVEREPFPHIVADNVLKPEVYAALERYTTRTLGRGLSEEADATRFSPFLGLKRLGKEWEYDGYLYVPSPAEDDALKLFYSLEWNLLFSRLFSQPADYTTSVVLHHHPPGNRTGFVHNDYSHKRFLTRNTLSNGVIHGEYEGAETGRDSIVKNMRVIALLLYLGDGSWQEGDGGGTGLYAQMGLAPVKIAEPKANRLLAFQISPKSFHAFQMNHADRNSLAQWFHMNPAWCQKKYGHV